MFKLKPLSEDAIPAALEKATCYRYLNEPAEAESICLDILEVEPDNQQAIITLILALTDQFERNLSQQFPKAREVVQRLTDEYCRIYYRGIICERRAKVHFERGGPGSGHLAYDWFRQALDAYEKAIDKRLAGNDDAILRWNACARLIMNNSDLAPAGKEGREQMLE
jgi:tetratricopeptide (TPR) repeat protein